EGPRSDREETPTVEAAGRGLADPDRRRRRDPLGARDPPRATLAAVAGEPRPEARLDHLVVAPLLLVRPDPVHRPGPARPPGGPGGPGPEGDVGPDPGTPPARPDSLPQVRARTGRARRRAPPRRHDRPVRDAQADHPPR